MKRVQTFLLFASLGIVSCSWIAEPLSINQREPLDLTGIKKLEIQGTAGNFSVLKGKESLLSVQGVGRVMVNTKRLGSTLQIISSGDTNCYPCTVNIEIQIEQALELSLNASNGSVSVKNAATNATLTSGNGEIYASGVGGQVTLSTSNGKITLENSVLPASSANLMRSGNGDIRVKNVTTTGGFVIRGNQSTLNFGISGFELLMTSSGFTATRAGAQPTTLNLETDNGTIYVSP